MPEYFDINQLLVFYAIPRRPVYCGELGMLAV